MPCAKTRQFYFVKSKLENSNFINISLNRLSKLKSAYIKYETKLKKVTREFD